MARRSQGGDTASVVIILAVAALAALYFLATVFLTWSVYASLLCLAAAMAYVELQKPPHVGYPTTEELNRENKKVLELVPVLEDWEKDLREQQWQIYNQGDRLGIPRRNSDGRFHARGKGRALNARLAQLDQQFEATAGYISEVRTELRFDKIGRNDAIRRWQAHHQIVLSIRTALIAYVTMALVFALTPWSTSLSTVVSAHMWFDNPAIRGLDGPLVVATMSAALAGACSFYSNSPRATHQLDPLYFSAKCVRDIAEFKKAHDLTAAPDVEDEFRQSDGYDEPETEPKSPEEQPTLSPYEILGIAENASREEIVNAHRHLVKQYHPDLLRSLGPKLQTLGHVETQKLNTAKDEALRRL